MSREHGAVCFTYLKLCYIKTREIEKILVHAVARKRKNVRENGESLKIF